MKKLGTSDAIEHLMKVAQKLKLEVQNEETGIIDDTMGVERHLWLEDKDGKTKGSYFYWIKDDNINQSEGMSYVDVENGYNYKSFTDISEIYKAFQLKMPRQKKAKKEDLSENKWEQVKVNFFRISQHFYDNVDFDNDDSYNDLEKENAGFKDRFVKFSETEMLEYWNRIERELWQLDNWNDKEIKDALFRVMYDYEYDKVGCLSKSNEIAFILSFYFTAVLKAWFRWDADTIELFWDNL